ncbi:3-oxo-tetronate kinase [Ruania halotolerans]|uniref:3-oxo-tetronate kinase n=1 Tax=Ruania halotolerans TaxID=2897773 RepID=UPI001E5F5716|nr:3-oxo-tetronate kinase [Ruania halotolerans]UFU06091.1 four-carbon acid sugar kinase family protein [Ruania halotolerans]
MVIYGGIADDFTGATDLAAAWRSRGLRTAVVLGLDDQAASTDGLNHHDAVVVALKIRTAPVAEAVDAARRAARLLRELGARQLYSKYCSTFDSTPAGNIGPVLDALSEGDCRGQAPGAVVVVPAFPAAGRTVYQGHLFVGEELLENSSMRHHPLTPMTGSHLPTLLEPQTGHRVGLVPWATVQSGAQAVRAGLDRLGSDGVRYAVVDALTAADLTTIAVATSEDPIVSGGSGLAAGLPQRPDRPTAIPTVPGHRAIVAGSASAATRGQVAAAREHLPHQRLDLDALRANLPGEVERLRTWASRCWAEEPEQPVLIYAVGELAHVQDDPQVAVLVEEALAACAVRMADDGARRFVVAGGETSGAVATALGVRALTLGASLGPGLAWAHGLGAGRGGDPATGFNLVLKSGNFGTPTLFVDAWEHLA